MNRNAVRPVLFSLALLALLVALGIWGLFAYIQLEQRRDLADWQQRLGMLADDRVADIEACSSMSPSSGWPGRPRPARWNPPSSATCAT